MELRAQSLGFGDLGVAVGAVHPINTEFWVKTSSGLRHHVKDQGGGHRN